MKDTDFWREVIAGGRDDVKHAEERLAKDKAAVIDSARHLVYVRGVLADLEVAHPEAADSEAQ